MQSKIPSVLLYQITAPHFCAGVLFRDGFIVKAAPILRWALGEHIIFFREYCHKKDWKIEEVESS